MPKVCRTMRWMAAPLCALAWVPLRAQDAGGAQVAWSGPLVQGSVAPPTAPVHMGASTESSAAALPATPATLTDVQSVLLEMATHAAVIFAGQVLSVTRDDAAGYVDVRFRVDQAVRGCFPGQAYVVREWAGRWIGQPDRYRVGQRLLMLLTAPGTSGMSAPVYGADGAIPVIAAGTQPLLDAQGNVPADTAGEAEPAVDLRWLAARIVRAAGAPLTLSSTSGQVHAAARYMPVLPVTEDPVVPAPVPVPSSPVAPGPVAPVSGSGSSAWIGPIAPLAGSGTGAASAGGTGSGSAGTATQPSLSAVLALLASDGDAHGTR